MEPIATDSGSLRRAGCARRLSSAALVAAALAVHAPARAAELSVQGKAPCPDTSELRFRVERTIGMSLDRALPLRFLVTFEPPVAGEYGAHIDVAGLDAHAAHVCRAWPRQTDDYSW